jgi:hypothetical protein
MVLAYHLASSPIGTIQFTPYYLDGFSLSPRELLSTTQLSLSHTSQHPRGARAQRKGAKAPHWSRQSLLPPSVGGQSASLWRTATTSGGRQPTPVRHHQAQGTVYRLQLLKVCCHRQQAHGGVCTVTTPATIFWWMIDDTIWT